LEVKKVFNTNNIDNTKLFLKILCIKVNNKLKSIFKYAANIHKKLII
jgi:hypothetical protein